MVNPLPCLDLPITVCTHPMKDYHCACATITRGRVYAEWTLCESGVTNNRSETMETYKEEKRDKVHLLFTRNPLSLCISPALTITPGGKEGEPDERVIGILCMCCKVFCAGHTFGAMPIFLSTSQNIVSEPALSSTDALASPLKAPIDPPYSERPL